MRNEQLIQKKMGIQILLMQGLKKYRIINIEHFFPLYKVLNYNFRLVIHSKNKIEPPTPQSTNL